MFLLQITTTQVAAWRDVILPFIYVVGGIYGAFILRKQVEALREQVNSQKEVVDRTKTYFEIFDFNKIREYAKLTEENATLRSQKTLDELNKQIEEKEAQALKLTQKHDELETANQKLETELEERKDTLERAQADIEIRMREVEARSKYPAFYSVPEGGGWERGVGPILGTYYQKAVCEFVDEFHPSFTDPREVAHSVEKEGIVDYIEKKCPGFKEIYALNAEHRSDGRTMGNSIRTIEKWVRDYMHIREILKPKAERTVSQDS